MSEVEVLAERAARYHDQILDVACGPGGMLIAFCHSDTRRPFQEGEDLPWFLASILDGVWGGNAPKPTVAEWYYGENTLWATGMFLWSQILRYRATQEQEALNTARKCFRDLNNIFRLCRQIEPGLLGKPHGGRAGPTTSFDQSACPVLFYVMFAQEMATPEEKAEAVENMAQHGEYYLRRNWVMNHHGNLSRIVDPGHTSTMKYLACVHAAYELTGETRYRDAAFRYLRQIIASGRLPWAAHPYEINHNMFYWALLCDYWHRTEIASEADWVGCIDEYWQAMKKAIDDEGLVRNGQYEPVKRVFTPYPHGWVDPEAADRLRTLDSGERRIQKRWVSPTCFRGRTAVSAYAVMLALLARSYGLAHDVGALASRTLLRLDEDTLGWMWDDGTLPDELKPIVNVFAPEIPAAWLAAYWMARLQGVL